MDGKKFDGGADRYRKKPPLLRNSWRLFPRKPG